MVLIIYLDSLCLLSSQYWIFRSSAFNFGKSVSTLKSHELFIHENKPTHTIWQTQIRSGRSGGEYGSENYLVSLLYLLVLEYLDFLGESVSPLHIQENRAIQTIWLNHCLVLHVCTYIMSNLYSQLFVGFLEGFDSYLKRSHWLRTQSTWGEDSSNWVENQVYFYSGILTSKGLAGECWM